MASPPLVSCVVPVFNGERFVAAALESIFRQTYEPIEIIVVNDGSTDGTKTILDRYGARITVIDQANAGASAARIRGVDACSGALLTFLDADDLWIPEKTEIQAKVLAAHRKAGICTCMIENFWEPEVADEEALLRGTEHDGPRLSTLQGILVRRDAFDRVGGLTAEKSHFDEIDLLMRAKTEDIAVTHVDRVLVRRRIHSDNLSRARGARAREDMLRIAQEAIRRRRASRAKS